MVTPIQPKANQKMIFFGIGILVGVLITLIGIKYITVKTPVSTTPSWASTEVTTPQVSPTTTPTTPSAKTMAAPGDAVEVDYVGRLDDGKLFDTSIESEAKTSGLYQTGRTYQPLAFTIGDKSLLPEFEKAIIGMSVGGKKTITIEAKDAYGEATIERSVPVKAFQDTIDQEVPKSAFSDSISQSVDSSVLGITPEELTKYKVGQMITIQGTQVRYVGNSGSLITIEIPNTSNPFMGKKIEVGAKAELEGNTITIKAVTSTGVILHVDNKSNPFYGKKLTLGLKGKMADGSEIEIKNIDPENITILTQNTHPLAGKRLTFDLTLVKINTTVK